LADIAPAPPAPTAAAPVPPAPAAPLHADVADGPDDGIAHFLTTGDGLRIRTVAWGRSAATAGTVLLFPGRTEFAEKYGRTARDLAELGLATLAVDWRGQGIAARLLPDPAMGHVWRFPDYQKDVAAMVAQARALDLPQPWFLLAHSMGGCIGLRALIEGLPVQAAVFTAPMWGIRMKAAMRPVAWTLSSLARAVRLGHLLTPGQTAETYILRAPFEENHLTSDPEMYAYMQRQLREHPDLALGGPSLQWLGAALNEMRSLAARPAPAVPTLAFLGTEEEIVEPGPIHRRIRNWPQGRLEVIPGARHEVLMERHETRRRIIDSLADHFRRATAA
jgi:lysophospholipase